MPGMAASKPTAEAGSVSVARLRPVSTNVRNLWSLPWTEPHSGILVSCCKRPGYRSMGFEIRRERPCKTVRALSQFGNAKSLNLQVRYRPPAPPTSTAKSLLQVVQRHSRQSREPRWISSTSRMPSRRAYLDLHHAARVSPRYIVPASATLRHS